MTKRINSKAACAVSKAGAQIGDLWSAYNAAEATKKHENLPRVAQGYAAISGQIDNWRHALEVDAGFHRAESLAGALVHIVLAQEVAKDLVSKIDPEPAERLIAHALFRMLASVGLLLRKEIGEDFAPLADFWRTYVGDGFDDDLGNPVMWTDNLPALVAAGRDR